MLGFPLACVRQRREPMVWVREEKPAESGRERAGVLRGRKSSQTRDGQEKVPVRVTCPRRVCSPCLPWDTGSSPTSAGSWNLCLAMALFLLDVTTQGGKARRTHKETGRPSSKLQPLPVFCHHGSCRMGAWVPSGRVPIDSHHLFPSRLVGARPLR